jgi:DNA-binding transcriptional ArsR family regulator
MTVVAPTVETGEQRDAELALLAKALGHPARVRILRLLLSRDACYCGQIVDEVPLAQATVSQHLKVLKDAGLVTGEIEGLRTCYCASRERLAEAHELLGSLLADAVDVDLRGCD